MAKLTENLTKFWINIKLWWYFLVIVAFFGCFFVGKTANATYTFHFDNTYYLGSTIGDTTNDIIGLVSGGSSEIVNTEYSSYPQSVKIIGNSAEFLYSSYGCATTSIYSLWFKYSDPDSINILWVNDINQVPLVFISISTSSSKWTYYNKGNLIDFDVGCAINTWCYGEIKLDAVADLAKVRVNPSGGYTQFNYAYNSTPTGCINGFDNHKQGAGTTYYVDDWTQEYYGSPPLASTTIIFFTPRNFTYAPSDFKWWLVWGISAADWTTYNDYYGYLRIRYKETNEATTTEIVDGLEEFGSYQDADHLLYDWSDNNILEIPQKLGNYTATADLIAKSIGETDFIVLASATTTFTMGTSTTDNILIKIPSAWCANLCIDLDPSLFNPYDYLVCAGRVLFCYAFVPKNPVIQDWIDTSDKLTQAFPLNVYFTLASSTMYALNRANLNQNNTFGIPFIRQTGTTTQFYILPVLTATSMPNLIGNNNYSLLRETLGWFLWIYVIGFIIIQFKKI